MFDKERAFHASQYKEWAENFISLFKENAVWAVPCNESLYRISHKDKTLTLLMGNPKEITNKRNKQVFALIGYKFVDGTQKNECPI